MITFEETGIRPELVKAITELGFQNPMPVQEKAIPVILGSKQRHCCIGSNRNRKNSSIRTSAAYINRRKS